MFTLDSPFNISFFITALALLIIFAVSILTRIILLKRERSGANLFFIAINAVFIVLMILLSAIFAFAKYPNSVIAVYESGGNLAFKLFGLQFSIGKAGALAVNIIKLNVVGIVAPLAVLLLSIGNLITIILRTFKVKKIKVKSDEHFITVAMRPEEINHTEIKEIENETIPFLPSGKGKATNVKVESKDAAKSDKSEEINNPKSILSEIDKLVAKDESLGLISTDSNIESELDRAIKEGLKLTEDIFAQADEDYPYDNVSEGEEPLIESDEESLVFDSSIGGDNFASEDADEGEQSNEVEDINLGEGEELEQIEQIEQIAADTKFKPTKNKGKAKQESIEVEHFEEQRDESLPAFDNVFVPKVRTIVRKPPSGKKKFDYTDSKRSKAKPDVKVVEATQTGLPLTKKYVIINRQSAANVFSEYLKNKRAEEQGELKDSLNIIILK